MKSQGPIVLPCPRNHDVGGSAREHAGHVERPIRIDLVQHVRREIARGTYETPEKWDVALERMLDRLQGGTP